MSGSLDYLKPGDILLMRNPHGRFNPTYQQLMRIRKFRKLPAGESQFIPTHAALLLDNNAVIHSNRIQAASGEDKPKLNLKGAIELGWTMARHGQEEVQRHPLYPALIEAKRQVFGRGVDVEPIYTLLENENPEDLRLIRHPEFQKQFDSDQFLKLLNSALYHLDKPYNIFIEFYDGGNAAAFCSQLVYDVLHGLVSMPPSKANRVLPLDFLLWAKELGWPIFDGDAVKAEIKRRVEQDRVHDHISAAALMHRYTLKHQRDAQAAFEAFGKLNETVAQFIRDQGEVSLPPGRWHDLGLQPVPLSAEGAFIAADEVTQAIAGIDYREKPRGVSELTEAIQGPRSWLSIPERERQANGNPAELTIANSFLNHLVRLLDDYDECLEALRAAIEENTPFDQEPDVLERFEHISQFFALPENAEQAEKNIARASQRSSALGEQATKVLKAGICAVRKPSFDPNTEASRRHVIETFRSVLNLHVCAINYAVVMDFCQAASTLHTMKGETTIKETFLKVIENDRAAILSALTTFSEMRFRTLQQKAFEQMAVVIKNVFS
jgi:hypothetical protein